MELHVDQLHAYLHCPIKYRFEHVNNLDAEKSQGVLFKEAVHRAILSFYYTLMGGVVLTPSQMKDKWATIWGQMSKEKKDLGDFLLTPKPHYYPTVKKSRETDKYLMQGFEMVHNFHHFNKDNPGTPIAVDLEYRVPIGGITLVGKFELIREMVDKSLGTRFIEIVDFKTGNENTVDPFTLKNDINMTIASYAFRNLFQAKEDRINYHFLKTGKEVYTSRNENDFKRLEAIVRGVAKGIAEQHFYPRQTFMCKSCPFVDTCNSVQF